MGDKFSEIPNQNVPPVNVNVNDLEDIYCLHCEELYPEGDLQNIFRQSFLLKKLSAVHSPDGKSKYLPIPIFVCEKCGNMIDLENWQKK